MLSDCWSCKFFKSEQCAVNPLYLEQARPIRSRLMNGMMDLMQALRVNSELEACPDWEESEEIGQLPQLPSLSLNDWLKVHRNYSMFQGLIPPVQPREHEELLPPMLIDRERSSEERQALLAVVEDMLQSYRQSQLKSE